jgi:hypothetical protein
MPYRSVVAFVVLLSSTAPSLAQASRPFPSHQGTTQEQKACEPAVFKFCQHAVPDTFRVLQCLQTNRPRIGKACQAVLAAYGQ